MALDEKKKSTSSNSFRKTVRTDPWTLKAGDRGTAPPVYSDSLVPNQQETSHTFDTHFSVSPCHVLNFTFSTFPNKVAEIREETKAWR